MGIAASPAQKGRVWAIIEADKDLLVMSCLSNKHQGVVCEVRPSAKIDFNLEMYLQNSKKPFIIIFDST